MDTYISRKPSFSPFKNEAVEMNGKQALEGLQTFQGLKVKIMILSQRNFIVQRPL